MQKKTIIILCIAIAALLFFGIILSKQISFLTINDKYQCKSDNDCILVNTLALDPTSPTYCDEVCKFPINYYELIWESVNIKWYENKYATPGPCLCAPPSIRPAYSQCKENTCQKIISTVYTNSSNKLDTKITSVQNGTVTSYLVQYHYRGNIHK